MDEDATGTEVDLRAGHIVLDGFPALRERRTASFLLDPCLLWPRSPISATAELLLTQGLDTLAVAVRHTYVILVYIKSHSKIIKSFCSHQ